MRDTNDIQIFENKAFGSVRVVELNGNAWFVGKDVSDVLGYQNHSKAICDHVDDEDKLNNKSLSSLGQRGGWLINESGLYSLVLSSKMPEAKKFKRWITSEVIPTIRKHGAYMTAETLEAAILNPDTIIKIAQELKAEREKSARLEAHIEKEKPKVLFADAVATSDSTILIGELAKILKGNGVDIGQNRLFAELRERGYLIKRKGTDYNMPTQRSMELGLFRIKETAITHSDGHVSVSRTAKVTGKGQEYFVNLFLGGKEDTIDYRRKNGVQA